MSALSNGELLAMAEQQFDVLVTTDKQLRYQQNLKGRKIAIFVLPYASWPKMQRHAEKIASAIIVIQPGSYEEIQLT